MSEPKASPNGQWDEAISTPLHETLLGNTARVREIMNLVRRLAPTDLTVLVTGETGTGKDIVAKLLHQLSTRKGKPFIKVNCPSIPEGILEGELFGYERGAFTGAHTAKPGRFELANEGTIFLDEISETSQNIQSKLVQVLDGEPYLRLGGTTPVSTNARVVAATNVSLVDAATLGKLREDISFRLSEVVIELPPLRERKQDIPLLAEHFSYNLSKMLNKEYSPMNAKLHEQLQELDWPGNIRELAGRVKKYVATGAVESLLLAQDGEKTAEDETPTAEGNGSAAHSNGERRFKPLKQVAKEAAEAAEKELIEETLRYTLWNRRKAAKLLDTSYSSLLRRIEAYKIGK